MNRLCPPSLIASLISTVTLCVPASSAEQRRDPAGPPVSEAMPARAGDERTKDGLPTDFRRTTLIVSDVDRSLAVYRDILGMKVVYDIETTMTGRAVPAGKAGDRARFVLMATNDPWVGLLGLLQWTDPRLEARRGDRRETVGPGDSVLIFRSNDVESRCRSVSRVPGVTMFSEPHVHVYPSRNNSGEIPLLFCVFFDPDGHLVELSELVSELGAAEGA